MKEIQCVICPKKCNLLIDDNNKVSGNLCSKGENYENREMIFPMRTIRLNVKTVHKKHRRLAIESDVPVPNYLVDDIVKFLRSVYVRPEVYSGEYLTKNILGTGINIVAKSSAYYE